MLTLETIYQAAFALKNVIRNTELIHAPQINPDVNVYIKPENLQVTGSFKVRGSAFKISQLSEEEKKACAENGVLYCSGMIAGEGLVGILLALLAVFGVSDAIDLSTKLMVSSKIIIHQEEPHQKYLHHFQAQQF